MHHFHYRDGTLHCEDVSLAELVSHVGTPCYVYSKATLTRHVTVFHEALKGLDHLICFSVKANSNVGVLSLLAKLGCGADIVSGGELFRSLRAGIEPQRIVFSGAGKQAHEVAEALDAGILLFNVESEAELDLIEQIARDKQKKAPIALRVKP